MSPRVRPGGHARKRPDSKCTAFKADSSARGKDILDAAEKGLVKAAEHFLRRDPKCMEAKNADGRETWALEHAPFWFGGHLWRPEVHEGI